MPSLRYAAIGALVGLGLPVVATFIAAGLQHGGLSPSSLLEAQASSPLLWIIDTVPLVMGFLALVVGRHQEAISDLETSQVRDYTQTANDLSAAARALLTTVQSFGAMTVDTASSVKQTANTMSQLSHTAMQAALTAETVIGLAQRSQKSSQEGLTAVEATSAGMVKVAAEVRSLAARLEALNGRMRDVFAITAVVNDVADHSSRLAQRAESEASKAIPSSSGFAEVARELRAHATDARNAAAGVQSILGEAHKAMMAALTSVETGSREAEAGAQLARSTGETIRKLADVIRESSEAARQIAMVAQQQDRGIDEVLRAMNEVYLAVEEGQAATQKVAAEAQALNSLAEGLKSQAKR